MTNAAGFFIHTLLLAVMVMFAAVSAPAIAADLYDGGHPPPAASDDQRYRDIYGHPPPRSTTTVRHYEERYEERSYRVREDRGVCLRPHEIESRLYDDGWRDIGDLDFDVRQVHVNAVDGDTGREVELTLDSCTGRILQAEPGLYHWSVRRYGYRH